MFHSHRGVLLAACSLLISVQIYAQCTGFPATVADGDCSGSTPLTSGVNINSGSNYGYCGSSPAYSSFTGLNLNGGTLRICGNANLSGNWNSGVLVVACGSTVTFPSGLLMNNNIKVINYGTVYITGDLNFQNNNNCFYNESSTSALYVSGNINYPQNSGQNAYLKNAGYIKVNGTFNALDGGFTCFSNTGTMQCTNIKYIQNCGGPANRFTFSSAIGNCTLQYTGSATLNASFTASTAWKINKSSGATQTLNCSSTWGSATVSSTSVVLPAPGTQVCATGNCFVSSPLPIQLVSFEATEANGTVELEWVTSSEVNNAYFTLEKSIDGVYWHEFATVDGAGNSNNLISYAFKDAFPYHGITYYRLRQTDFDGTFTYSEMRSVTISSESEWTVSLYPNPVQDELNIISSGQEVSRMIIYSISGLKLSEIQLNGSQKADVSYLAQGIYVCEMISETGQHRSIKLVKR